ncbi:hypothetical protein HF521_009761 [Silurus meridionalis]|uniref:Ig-like domain-containing protein n=1 Tax=Silurus meridionalis TaxID=175797 RepID=A0A8T0BUW3_SILME|nr:hypothetical protein HF521_009761 [Silurus meridionalis]
MMTLNTFALTAIVLTLSGVKALVLTQEKTMYSISSIPRSAGSSQSLSSADGVRVVCLAQGFRPDGATLSWSDNGNAVTGAEVQTGSSQRQSDGTFSQNSVLLLSPERWSSGRIYTCHLNHPALTAPLSQSASAEKCS